ncbi:4-alpha-glucanotransferase [Affinibrenneria salicis]|uniref:4-alpha-glucanotransferase n=1 Tax=Affinibrenneria salicis TaxID=2590031 RepID=A0A5J5FUJ9_9GAMM|nr:4-alpha-glucanotransferase [Affinibrenneria salicis]KAA8996397.1 4-alpha-glucanotransferase [Affinibrenneria salicis]
MASTRARKQTTPQVGVAGSYIDAYGNERPVAESTRQALQAMIARDDTSDAPLPPVKVFLQHQDAAVSLAGKGSFDWTLSYENGGQVAGRGRAGKTLLLPGALPLGYHLLTLEQAGRQWSCRIIIAPARCYEPPALGQGRRWWGVCAQLYTLRSQTNWGIGDFGDLRLLIEQIARRGGAFVGLNPLHALYPCDAQRASPYSPSSRRWLNVIYIDVNQVDDFRHSHAAQRWWGQEKTRRQLEKVRGGRWVDYPQVMALKLTALRMAFRHFNTRVALDPRVSAFRQFMLQGGENLLRQATFDVLQAHLLQQKGDWRYWQQWPAQYQDHSGEAVRQFFRLQETEIEFYCWLQWLAHEQISGCFEHSRQLGMPLGIYRDLAVGVAQGGAETWGDRALYCLDAAIGAPPDPLAPQGQNWQLPPMNPYEMIARGYQPFIDVLRSNMAHCGALRIDHVMSLLRLWWIPQTASGGEGSYVYYPLDDLLAVLALESQRHRCMVIGEDLGTVPADIIDKLRGAGVYSYKVLFFEQARDNHFRAPQEYPRQSLASVTTHDLPTLRGYWQSIDLSLGRELGLYRDDETLERRMAQREREKQGLLNALHQHGVLPQRVGRNAALTVMGASLNRGVQRYLADSNSALLGLQMEDWLDMATPVNVPGTSDEYPNWRRKLSKTLEAMFADPGLARLIRDIDLRRGSPPADPSS